jgi:hypothetical protein
MVFEDASGRDITARSVLITFADEPDWRMDDDLWQNADYGYGTSPYGAVAGTGSNAPFHMLFRHENLLMNAAAPEMKKGLTDQRIDIFRRCYRL